jgi:hypothetical protein
MLVRMDSSAAATGPLVALGVAGAGLLALAVVATVLLWRPRRAGGGRLAETPAPAPVLGFPEDDLPAFHTRPPGFPGGVGPRPGGPTAAVLLAPAPATAVRQQGGVAPWAPGGAGPSSGLPVARLLLTLAAMALALVAVAAAIALPSARAERAGAPPSRPAVPSLPAVPDAPVAGQRGAGELAYLSLPLGSGDVGARLVFRGLVLEQHAVGATVSLPTLSLTTNGAQGLAHLRLPTWNCLAPEAPTNPADAGCVPSVTEYADLPTPALRIAHNGTSVVLQGRFPSYVRPNGGPPEYTGRVYEVTVSITPGRRLDSAHWLADGVLTLGSATARTDGDPLLDVLNRGR